MAFVRQVRAALNARGSGYQLTFDATGSIGNYDVAALTATGAADAVLIMGYDYRGSGSSRAGSIDPLTGPTYDLTDTVNAYLARTSPARIILGVPYYGRAWSTASAAPNAPTLAQTSRNGYSVSATYAPRHPLGVGERAALGQRRAGALDGLPARNCSGCPTVRGSCTTTTRPASGLRYDIVNRKGLRGAGIWALGYDGTRPELDALLKAKFLNDTTPPVAGSDACHPSRPTRASASPGPAAMTHSGIAWYDVQVSVDGGAWKAWLTRTTVDQRPPTTASRATATPSACGPRTARQRRRVQRQHVYTASPTLRPGGFATVVQDGLNVRAAPGTAAALVTAGRGPGTSCHPGRPGQQWRPAWYEVALPDDHVGSHGRPAGRRVGRRRGSAATTYIAPIRAPNATLVAAAITGFSFAGAGAPASARPGRRSAPSPQRRRPRRHAAVDWRNGRA